MDTLIPTEEDWSTGPQLSLDSKTSYRSNRIKRSKRQQIQPPSSPVSSPSVSNCESPSFCLPSATAAAMNFAKIDPDIPGCNLTGWHPEPFAENGDVAVFSCLQGAVSSRMVSQQTTQHTTTPDDTTTTSTTAVSTVAPLRHESADQEIQNIGDGRNKANGGNGGGGLGEGLIDLTKAQEIRDIDVQMDVARGINPELDSARVRKLFLTSPVTSRSSATETDDDPCRLRQKCREQKASLKKCKDVIESLKSEYIGICKRIEVAQDDNFKLEVVLRRTIADDAKKISNLENARTAQEEELRSQAEANMIVAQELMGKQDKYKSLERSLARYRRLHSIHSSDLSARESKLTLSQLRMRRTLPHQSAEAAKASRRPTPSESYNHTAPAGLRRINGLSSLSAWSPSASAAPPATEVKATDTTEGGRDVEADHILLADDCAYYDHHDDMSRVMASASHNTLDTIDSPVGGILSNRFRQSLSSLPHILASRIVDGITSVVEDVLYPPYDRKTTASQPICTKYADDDDNQSQLPDKRRHVSRGFRVLSPEGIRSYTLSPSAPPCRGRNKCVSGIWEHTNRPDSIPRAVALGDRMNAPRYSPASCRAYGLNAVDLRQLFRADGSLSPATMRALSQAIGQLDDVRIPSCPIEDDVWDESSPIRPANDIVWDGFTVPAARRQASLLKVAPRLMSEPLAVAQTSIPTRQTPIGIRRQRSVERKQQQHQRRSKSQVRKPDVVDALTPNLNEKVQVLQADPSTTIKRGQETEESCDYAKGVEPHSLHHVEKDILFMKNRIEDLQTSHLATLESLRQFSSDEYLVHKICHPVVKVSNDTCTDDHGEEDDGSPPLTRRKNNHHLNSELHLQSASSNGKGGPQPHASSPENDLCRRKSFKKRVAASQHKCRRPVHHTAVAPAAVNSSQVDDINNNNNSSEVHNEHHLSTLPEQSNAYRYCQQPSGGTSSNSGAVVDVPRNSRSELPSNSRHLSTNSRRQSNSVSHSFAKPTIASIAAQRCSGVSSVSSVIADIPLIVDIGGAGRRTPSLSRTGAAKSSRAMSSLDRMSATVPSALLKNVGGSRYVSSARHSSSQWKDAASYQLSKHVAERRDSAAPSSRNMLHHQVASKGEYTTPPSTYETSRMPASSGVVATGPAKSLASPILSQQDSRQKDSSPSLQQTDISGRGKGRNMLPNDAGVQKVHHIRPKERRQYFRNSTEEKMPWRHNELLTTVGQSGRGFVNSLSNPDSRKTTSTEPHEDCRVVSVLNHHTAEHVGCRPCSDAVGGVDSSCHWSMISGLPRDTANNDMLLGSRSSSVIRKLKTSPKIPEFQHAAKPKLEGRRMKSGHRISSSSGPVNTVECTSRFHDCLPQSVSQDVTCTQICTAATSYTSPIQIQEQPTANIPSSHCSSHGFPGQQYSSSLLPRSIQRHTISTRQKAATCIPSESNHAVNTSQARVLQFPTYTRPAEMT